MLCPQCSSPISESAKFCESCGSPVNSSASPYQQEGESPYAAPTITDAPAQTAQQTSQSGYQADPGTSYQQPYEQANQQTYQQPYQQSTYQQAPAPTQAPAQKNHIVAGLLAIFFGAFGIHKFYLGYSKAGIIMLLVTLLGSLITFGLAAMVMGIIGVIEGVMYLVKTDEDFYYTYELTTKEWF